MGKRVKNFYTAFQLPFHEIKGRRACVRSTRMTKRIKLNLIELVRRHFIGFHIIRGKKEHTLNELSG